MPSNESSPAGVSVKRWFREVFLSQANGLPPLRPDADDICTQPRSDCSNRLVTRFSERWGRTTVAETDRQTLPTFLVIGATRSGTTWLHAVLARHPDIFVPAKKELNFFNERILTEDFESYLEEFTPRDGGKPKPIRGDMSVNYSILQPAVVERV